MYITILILSVIQIEKKIIMLPKDLEKNIMTC